MTAMNVRISSTGKTISFKMPMDAYHIGRASLYYDKSANTLSLTPNSSGRLLLERDGGLYVSYEAGNFPDVPMFAPVNVEAFIDEAGTIILQIPTSAAPAKPIIRNKKSANVVAVIDDMTLSFQVPGDELLKMALRYAHAGYSVGAA